MTVDKLWIDSVPPPSSPYWRHVRARASALGSDGCTDSLDIYVDACFEHDCHWRLGTTVYGVPITTAQANRRFRKVIQARDPLGRFSLLAWWRWAAVTIAAPFISHAST